MNRKNQSERFNDYEGFVEKFKPKKTTDYCYTPEPEYDVVLSNAKAARKLTHSPHVVTSAPLRRYAQADASVLIPKSSAVPYPTAHRDGIFGTCPYLHTLSDLGEQGWPFCSPE